MSIFYYLHQSACLDCGLKVDFFFFCAFNHKDEVVSATSLWSQWLNLLITFQFMMHDGAKSLGPWNKAEEIPSLELFNYQRCNTLRWPILYDTSPSRFPFSRSVSICLAIQRFARQISMYDNGIMTFSVCCRQTWPPKFAVFGFNMKASVKLYQNQGAIHSPFPRVA